MSHPTETRGLRVAVIGPGGIGSTFAFHLSRAGHDVTVVARGDRLQRLRCDEAIVTVTGERAAVHVADALDPTTAWDLVLVTVLAAEVEVLLPSLADCAAHTIMFMFNTFRSLDRLRDTVGTQRAVFGFPAIVAGIEEGELSSTILRRGAPTIVSDRRWATVFSEAGIPSSTQPDMQSWLRTHVALVVPLMLAAHSASRNGRGVDRHEAAKLARALREGLHLVRELGNSLTPSAFAILDRLPVPVIAAILWALSRLPAFVRTVSVAPKDEPAALIDEMNSAAPQGTQGILTVRPR
ncbi:ketopantoate reductase family protein [Nocardia tenerifensis]|uniref:ketopantoate reductase family protein n=1 Tax=Nocardia tenerifensis TaxID=228006 RepID=UPI000685E953|nr:2-dehydropantoate 2-reductase N-terminal domain-containing protein [Nocardia tenerifensis]